MRIRLIIAVWACKFAIFISRLMGKMGTSMPGHLAMVICPDILSRLSKQVKKEIIVVCGTNGKTTTNNLLTAFIESKGNRVVSNLRGANMIWGVCCAFAEKADLFGRLRADYACLEVDEASTVKVLQHVKPTKMVVTNLFRDQLDRYGEVEKTLDFIRCSLELSPDTELLINADDPVVSQLGENTNRRCYYFGIDEDTKASKSASSEGRFCICCGSRLEYEYCHYSQLGKFSCPNCGFKRHTLDFRVHSVDLSDGVAFTLYMQEKSLPFHVHYRGLYNIYNIAMAYCAAAMSMGELFDYQAVLDAYHPQIGRMEEFCVNGKNVIVNLAKNPAGFNQAIAAVMTDQRSKNILLAVNDNPSDGQDISWLWDVDFEKLVCDGIISLTVCGLRASELLLRMKYAGYKVTLKNKADSYKDAILKMLEGEGEVCYVLANYTAVFPIQAMIKELEKGEEGHGA